MLVMFALAVAALSCACNGLKLWEFVWRAFSEGEDGGNFTDIQRAWRKNQTMSDEQERKVVEAIDAVNFTQQENPVEGWALKILLDQDEWLETECETNDQRTQVNRIANAVRRAAGVPEVSETNDVHENDPCVVLAE